MEPILFYSISSLLFIFSVLALVISFVAFVSEIPTLETARGPTGDAGPKGETGPPGDPGLKGPDNYIINGQLLVPNTIITSDVYNNIKYYTESEIAQQRHGQTNQLVDGTRISGGNLPNKTILVTFTPSSVAFPYQFALGKIMASRQAIGTVWGSWVTK